MCPQQEIDFPKQKAEKKLNHQNIFTKKPTNNNTNNPQNCLTKAELEYNFEHTIYHTRSTSEEEKKIKNGK